MTTTTSPNRAAIVATLAANLPTLRAYLPNPRDVARELLDFTNSRHYTVKIEWLWVGRERHGVVHIFDRAGACVFLTEYVRSETRWDGNDALLTSCNRGSNKHHALVRALAYMRSLPRRQCGGVSDNLPH